MEFLIAIKNIISVIFFLSVLSYYFLLLFVRQRNGNTLHKFNGLSIIIPAHNEEEYISQTLKCVLAARFAGKKEIIVIDDGSKDRTAEIAKEFRNQGVRLISTAHSGKSASINRALKAASGELIAIVDADSYIDEGSLMALADEIGKKNVAAATGVIKVYNRKRLFGMWLHLEQIYNSLIRSVFSKINANVVTPGPLSMYRADCLKKINGFSTDGLCEDTDVAIRLIRKGYTIGFSDKAISATNMPYTLKGFVRQRFRLARGLVDILKKHLQLNSTAIDLYTLPLLLFTYFQAVIISCFTLYQIFSGYFTYFVSQGQYFTLPAIRFFFEWLSIVGFGRWAFGLFTGATPLTAINVIGILSTMLSYPLFLFAIYKYDKKFDLFHIIPFVFMFPFWLFVMVIITLCIPEYFKSGQPNIWKKNE